MEEEEELKSYYKMRGWLLKWTNYVKGYQSRWFVLSDDVLSYYRNEAEMAHTCRGSVNLTGALIHTHNSLNFIISNGSDQIFYLKAANEVERQRWVTALELAKAKAISTNELSEQIGMTNESDYQRILISIIKALGERIENLQICYNLIIKHSDSLKGKITEFENVNIPEKLPEELQNLNQEVTSFRVTSGAMINACIQFLEMAKFKFSKLVEIVNYEKQQRERLDEVVEHLKNQYSLLEKAINNHEMITKFDLESITESRNDIKTEEVNITYCESVDGSKEVKCIGVNESNYLLLSVPEASVTWQFTSPFNNGNVKDINFTNENLVKTENLKIQQTDSTTIQAGTSEKSSKLDTNPSKSNPGSTSKSKTSLQNNKICKRRSRIPDKPNYPLNLWSFLKNCIGKELTKIPMPVNFSEPLSMLQRITEDYSYSYVLDRAALCENSFEQLAHVAAFTISNYSTAVNRLGKPFNPLLGETYECDRTDDMGWRCITEQVSHHPPIAAQHCEGRGWICWQEFCISSKFRGKYLQVTPLGISHLLFSKSGNHITWRKVTTTINNIIIGKIWIDQSGEVDVTNHTDGSICHLSYLPYSYFKSDNQRRVKGCAMDKNGTVKWTVNGTWDKQVDIAPVLSSSGTKDNPVYKTGDYITAWEMKESPPNSEKMYNFSLFACQLNEMEDGVAPTDSRNRPDQRLMEEGKWDEANVIKVALEDKQRAARKDREKAQQMAVIRDDIANEQEKKAHTADHAPVNDQDEIPLNEASHSTYEPIWFKKEIDTVTGNISYVYKGTYWDSKKKQEWKQCPNIYL